MGFEEAKCFVSTSGRFAGKAKLREYRRHDFRTETSSSTISTRRERECANGIGSVAKCHPAPAALSTSVKTGFFPFSRACSARRDVIQGATVVNYFALQKRVLMHEGDHPAQDLAARKSIKLNRLVAVARSLGIPCSKMVPATDSFPQWNKKPSSGIHSSLSRKWVMLFALTPARIILTLHVSLAKMFSPLPKSNWFV